MNIRNVRVVQIFLSEKNNEHEKLLERLNDEWKVHGVTISRGVAGFGNSGRMHTTRIFDVSHDLPITIEFYDAPEKVDEVLTHLDHIKPGHLVTWLADMWMGSDN